MEENVIIRNYSRGDLPEMINLSILAWEPVFKSFNIVLGDEIFSYLYPNWQKSQADGVKYSCKKKQNNIILVAENEGKVVGYIIYKRRKKLVKCFL
jgi:hypothetical protein